MGMAYRPPGQTSSAGAHGHLGIRQAQDIDGFSPFDVGRPPRVRAGRLVLVDERWESGHDRGGGDCSAVDRGASRDDNVTGPLHDRSAHHHGCCDVSDDRSGGRDRGSGS